MGEGTAFSKQWLTAVLATVALAGCQPETTQQATNNTPPPVAVDVVKVTTQPVEVTSTLPGRTSAYRIAEVRPQVSGIVIKRLFVEGTLVEQGDVLFALDPATYQATLASTKANLAKAEATLAQTEYQAKRYRELVAKKSISQQDYEDAQASYKEALASVAAAKANVNSAQINLDYTQIKAPISGRIGRTLITEGALVTANQTNALATIQQLDPLYVDLSQPSNALLKLRQAAGVENKELGGIQLFLDDGTPIKQQATLQFAEVSVNENTGTVNIRATIPNADHFLLPGLYVRAIVPTEHRGNGILISQAAVTRNARGEASVFIVNEQNQIEKRMIETSRTIGNQWLVDSGLQADDLVVVKGLQKIQPGSTVTTNVLNDVKEQ